MTPKPRDVDEVIRHYERIAAAEMGRDLDMIESLERARRRCAQLAGERDAWRARHEEMCCFAAVLALALIAALGGIVWLTW